MTTLVSYWTPTRPAGGVVGYSGSGWFLIFRFPLSLHGNVGVDGDWTLVRTEPGWSVIRAWTVKGHWSLTWGAVYVAPAGPVPPSEIASAVLARAATIAWTTAGRRLYLLHRWNKVESGTSPPSEPSLADVNPPHLTAHPGL